jgi:hypothetical protein
LADGRKKLVVGSWPLTAKVFPFRARAAISCFSLVLTPRAELETITLLV